MHSSRMRTAGFPNGGGLRDDIRGCAGDFQEKQGVGDFLGAEGIGDFRVGGSASCPRVTWSCDACWDTPLDRMNDTRL